MPENVTVNKELGIIEVHSYGDVTREDLDLSLATINQIYKSGDTIPIYLLYWKVKAIIYECQELHG